MSWMASDRSIVPPPKWVNETNDNLIYKHQQNRKLFLTTNVLGKALLCILQTNKQIIPTSTSSRQAASRFRQGSWPLPCALCHHLQGMSWQLFQEARPMWPGRIVILPTGSSGLPLSYTVLCSTSNGSSSPYHISKHLGHSPPLAAINFTFFKLSDEEVVWCVSRYRWCHYWPQWADDYLW